MAADNFIYQGINRAVSDYAGTRACEELINLRPTEGGVVPVRDFVTKMANMPFNRIFVHNTTSGPKYIVVRTVTEEDAVLVQYVDENGEEIQTLFSTPDNGDQTLDAISYAAAGNIIFISLCDKEGLKFKNAAWTWKGSSYVAMEADVPEVDYEIDDGTDIESATQSIPPLTQDSESPEVISAVENGINAVLENNPRLCIGPFIIAVAYKTNDGKTFWTNNWKIYDPLGKIGNTSPPYMTSSDLNQTYTAPLYTDFFAKYGNYGYVMNDGHSDSNGWLGKIGKSLDEIRVFGTNVTLTFPPVSGWSEETSIIQSVEVYCSRPVPYLDTSSAADGFKSKLWSHDQDDYFFNILVTQKKYEDMELDGQLLYHQASIPMASLADGQQTVELTFGGSKQVTEDTLAVDAGTLKRYGRILVYNARFHYYDSVSRIEEIGMPYFYQTASGSTATADVFVRYADNEREGLYYLGTESLYKSDTVSSGVTKMVISPSLCIKEVIVLFGGTTGPWHTEYYRMTSSSSYNYSICVGGPYETKDTSSQQYVQDLIDAKSNTTITTFEPDAINVTEQYNPFVFLVEHSYKAPGNVIDVVPQMAGVVDANYGRDPLNVFTERGTYALTQGSANVLYGAFLPLSNLRAARGGLSLESGIYFLADGGLWLVSGRQVVLVSEALNLGPHKYIRSSTGYRKLSGDETPGTEVSPYYDASPYLSKVEFKDFVTGAQLSYNRFRMEIFISNKLYDYSYVLSLKYRQWFKISKRLWQDDPGSIIINRKGTVAGTISVLDMSDEVTTGGDPLLVHLQSRPFSMGYSYSHIHRIVSMVRARLSTSGHKIAVGLYGSDDLQRWKLLAYAKRNGTKWDAAQEEYADADVFLAQVRTTSSARSWRYYTVCIGGEIPVDADFPTDFGPVIVDYEPVIRRIG